MDLNASPDANYDWHVKSQTSHNSHLDRLPDGILLHILSFMSTKDGVRSSILSKRWRFLWVRVPNLKFNSEDHKTLRNFSIFLFRFVNIHKGKNINTLRLKQDNDIIDLEVETLIDTAIACNVQVLEIVSHFIVTLPRSIFTCETLVDLRIDCYLEKTLLMTGTTAYLPALKKLELRKNTYGSEEFLMHLLSGCPALEELKISKHDSRVVRINVSSPTITRLDLEIQFDDVNVDNKVFELKLVTPALKYLKLFDFLSEDFSVGMLASLTEADVVFRAQTNRDVLYSLSVLKFVGKLNNVSCLKLNTVSMEVPDSAFSALEFRNLTKLELAGDDWRFLTKFLETSDSLEVLTISMGPFIDDLQNWMEPKQVPGCLIFHLGTVSFFYFKCSEPEFNIVKYILRNAKVLKTMEIHVANGSYESIDDLKKKYEALQRISMFERASEACQLAFK